MSVPIEVDERIPDDTEQPVKAEKPRGTCTGCAFEYQLGTARTGEYKGELVIRKHNSRTGPGLCSGAQQPPESEHGTPPRTNEGHCEQGACTGCCGCSPMCTTDPCGQPYVPLTEIRLPVGPRPDVVGVAPGGTPIVVTRLDEFGMPVGEPRRDTVGAITLCPGPVDPWTAPVPAMDVESGQGEPDGRLGPWVTAAFDSECDGDMCGVQILEGDEIRADGEGGWLCKDCGSEEPSHVRTTPGIQALADATAIREQSAHSAVQPGAWTPTGTVLDRMTPEQRADSLEVSRAVIAAHAMEPPAGPAPDPFTAPAPASLIPESTTTVSGQPEPDRDRWGRYLIMGQAHTRATTFAKLGANTKAIGLWNERNVIRGLTLRPDLLMLANGLEVKRDRDQLNSIASQAKDAAGSKVAANIGTAYHAFSERIDAGLMTISDVPVQYQRRVEEYTGALYRAGLTTRPEWIERTTAVRADQIGAPLPVAGTLDRIFQMPDGSLVIGDLKTGADLSYGEMEIEVQLALYAHGVNTHGLFDWNTKTWHTVEGPGYAPGGPGLKVRTDIAIVAHLPADGDGCTLYVADIERGWRDAQRLGPLQASLKDKPKGKRFRTLMASDLAPRPAPVEQGEVAQYLAKATPTWASHDRRPTQPTPVIEPPDSHWEHAKGLFSSAPDQAAIAQLYQFALDSGRFHVDQLAVLVGLGKDRLNALARTR